jgi:hypothetical protein
MNDSNPVVTAQTLIQGVTPGVVVLSVEQCSSANREGDAAAAK